MRAFSSALIVENSGYLFFSFVLSAIMDTDDYMVEVVFVVKYIVVVGMAFVILFTYPCMAVLAADDAVAVDYESYLYDDTGNLIPTISEQRSVEHGDGTNEFVDLKIHSGMLSFLDTSAPFDIIYNVRAESDGNVVYSNMLCCEVLDANGGDIELVDVIPVGSNISVECAYPGPCYSLWSGHDPRIVFDDTSGLDRVTANFGFAYNFDNINGSGIVNTFHVDALVTDDGFRMPETGGYGVGPYVACGIVLVACGSLFCTKRGERA